MRFSAGRTSLPHLLRPELSRRPGRWSRASRLFLLPLLVVLLLPAATGLTRSASPLYPDLRTLPPSNLLPDTVIGAEAAVHVLRFTTTVWNAGQGPLELRGVSSADQTLVYQRIYDDGGSFAEHPVGAFTYHPGHNHWHFENFADYELWTRADYDRWLAGGRAEGQPGWRGSKTTGQGESFCVRDSRAVQSLPGSPPARSYSSCGREIQGISVGWGDTYRYNLVDQWIELGDAPLANGDYVLRVIADPRDLLYESGDKADPERESFEAKEAVTVFSVRNGRIQVRPS